MIERVISGGQSGVDLAALDAAKECGIATGGAMPKGFLTEDGPRPEYAEKYGMFELATSSYPARTRTNVYYADGTLILTVGKVTGGTRLTKEIAQDSGRPVTVVDLGRADGLADVVREWLEADGVMVLNVAGSRESKQQGIYAKAKAFLLEVFKS